MCLEAGECCRLLECYGIPLLVPVFFSLVCSSSMQLLDRGHHPHISTGFGGKHFTPLVSVLFMECQLHIMKTKPLILGTHELHEWKLTMQAYKH